MHLATTFINLCLWNSCWLQLGIDNEPTQFLKTTRVPLIWLATLCTTSAPNISIFGMTSFVKKWLMERTSFWRFHSDSTLPLFIPRPLQNMCSTCCHRIITEIDTVWCSYGAYFMMLKWSLFYIAQLEPILCLWYYDISMDCYNSKDTLMDVTIYIDTIWYFYDMLYYKR